ncbi:uncharacterized protein AC631_03920 [Debaryomyces fabryi]|uniref:thioredoxin-dependent peroxiredoxin n=1 Tax=Debaryomyces fabryi TaxID=58627 RepID=A0A0V1PVW5_9ASCO|nr:uncharacterized protein AC631_03920 [Debaryomyces fabryi]KSA00306.1 hypothetical protein AC631_03920 [Debaryomyces fabryi]CUM56249.1 unnamed protein product [Debaryomyces fabryi]
MPELRRSARVASKPTSSPTKETKETQSETQIEPPTKKVQTSSVKELQVGDKMPAIKLLDEEENEIDLLKEAESNKYVIIFAYPKASTPGCTRQVCGFQENFSFLQKSNAKVYGLSADKPSAQKNFVTKQKLQYPLLSDPSRELIEVLGAKKEPTGIKRSHWIFVDGLLKVKKIAISPEESFNSAKTDIETFIGTSSDNQESKEAKPEDSESKVPESKESKSKENEPNGLESKDSETKDGSGLSEAQPAASEGLKEELKVE